MSVFFIIFLFFYVLVIFCLMNIIYQIHHNAKIKKCLLNFDILEREVLKTILLNKEQTFPLTKNSPVTKKFFKLNILFKVKENDEKNPLNSVFKLNLLIFELIRKDKTLKQIYLP
ncbi:super-infection exclusion protein B [Candidatus Phytoplasma palmae]|uniref:super-infection exclusion protein B n=1 Tax=Candidatus Phytoplasma palmae TaxID=85624 RepID=UPI003990B809